jgi:hypothetical protein
VASKVEETRWANLKALAITYTTLSAFSRATRTDLAALRRYVLPGKEGNTPERWIGERKARRFEESLGLETGYLDIEHAALEKGSPGIQQPAGAAAAMSKVKELRWDNLKRLAARYETIAAFGRATGIDLAAARRYLLPAKDRHGPMMWVGEQRARRFETALDLPEGYLDTVHDASADLSFTGASGISVEGLTNLQKAVVDTVVKLSRQGKLTESACIELLQGWKDLLE